MAILDAFYLVFKGDIGDAKNKIGVLDKTVTRFEDHFKRATRNVGKSIAALVTVAAALSAAKYADELGELSDALDVDIEQLSLWSDAVKLSGGTAEGFQETVKFLTAAFQEHAIKGHSRITPFYQALGIKLRDASGHARNFLDVLPELAEKFEKMSKREAFGVGQKLGLDRGTIMLLQKGRKELDEFLKKQKELGIITKQDAETSAQFNDELDNLKHVFRSVFVSAGGLVLPTLTWILKGFQKVFIFLRNNKNFVTGAIIAISSAITAFLTPAIVGMVVASAPIWGVVAAVTALGAAFALAYDDVKSYLDGQKSLVGYIFDNYPIVKTLVTSVIGVFQALFDLLLTMGKFIFDVIFNPSEALKNLKENLTGVVNKIYEIFPSLESQINLMKSAFTDITDYVKTLWQSVIDSIKSTFATVTEIIKAIGAIKSRVVSVFSSGDKNPMSKQSSIQSGAIAKSFSTISSPAYAYGGDKNVTLNTGAIEINTQATDARGVSLSLTDELTRQFRQAINTLDDGVAI